LKLAYGSDHPKLSSDSIASMQTVSGTGALRMGLELIRRYFPTKVNKIYTTNVTWSLHYNIIKDAGF
jgi:aromatic-amino-acid transaminase